jgi:hypothetical protein
MIEGGVGEPDPSLPDEASAEWARATAAELLDSASSGASVTAGLSRFLETWLNVPRPQDADYFYADLWAAVLVEQGATLTTLLTKPTDDPQRSGLLTDAQLLDAHGTSSGRGAWLYNKLLSGSPPPPPPADIPALDQQPDETRRQAMERHVAAQPACWSCHAVFEPIGWSLEHFDDAGAYRTTDNGLPVDSSGTLTTSRGEELSFTGIDELAPQLGESCAVMHAFTRAMMNHAFAVSDPSAPAPYSEAELNLATNRFIEANGSIRALVTAVVETPSFRR